MQLKTRALVAFAVACALLCGAQFAFAQNTTTGDLVGVVKDAQKAVLPGASVVAIHVPTGTTYEATTQADGRFAMVQVRVGGPYKVTASMSGFKTEEQSNIQVALGESRIIEFVLPIQTVQESVTVVATAQIIDTTRAGTGSNVALSSIESLPTISRSIQDFARTSPFFNVAVAAAGDSDAAVSVAGRNNRYNNMQIDGAVNNDVFGLASSGTPGGQTGTQPVSLDAIQEIQLVVSPYDVRQGGFSGGGINAITKSGTNALHGGGYYFGRNQKFIGRIAGLPSPANPSPAPVAVPSFSDKQMGLSLGGPILQNKLFFFANYDRARKITPLGWAADGSASFQFNNPALAQQVMDIAKNQYGYDPGGLGEVSRPNNSDKYFGRFDVNISARNQLTFRVNYVNASFQSGSEALTYWNFPSNFYNMSDKMLSSVAQLNSSFGQAFNELRVSYSRERNLRGAPPGFGLFPQVRVYANNSSGSNAQFGTEYSSQANALNQDIVQVSDDVTYVKGPHTLSIGTQNEFYKFYNVYLPNAIGSYTFSRVENFQAGIAQGYQHNFSLTSDPNQAAKFTVRQFGFYVGDKWRAAPNFTLTFGARLDLPRFPTKQNANPKAVTNYGFATDVVPTPTMFSPRAGFNWDLSSGSGKRSQIRGGFGLFSGRTPYVWLSNQFSNTGVDGSALTATYSSLTENKFALPFVTDPNNQPTSIAGASIPTTLINMIDPKYQYPKILRGNIAYDRDLGFLGLYGTAEFLFTRNLKDIAYKNVNFIPTGSLPDGRPIYGRFDSTVADAMLLTNTSEGKTYTMVVKLERPFKNGFSASGSYLYGRAWSVGDGMSSVARSNWSGIPIGGNTNNPPLTRSNYDVGGRLNFSVTAPIPMFKGLRSNLSFFYNGQHGRPYAMGFSNDANGDGVSQDLLFVPATSDQVIISAGGTWDQLDAYLKADPYATKYRGQIMPRNAGRSPWYNSLDGRYALTIPTGGRTKLELTADVFNVLNLLNRKWGWQFTAGFPGFAGVVQYAGIDAATGKMKYSISTITASTFQGTFYRDDLRSRWQAQFGARFRF